MNTLKQMINNAPAQIAERVKEYWQLQDSERKHLHAFFGLALIFVYVLLALACRH